MFGVMRRYVATHRSTFSKFRRAVLTNTFLLHAQRGKLGILILKRLLKMVIFFSHLLASHSLIVFVLLSDGFTMLQFLSPPTLLVPSLLQTHPCFNLLTCTAFLIHSHFWETLPLALLL